MTTEKIINNTKVYYHHTSWARGYVSRKKSEGIMASYAGRFGKGIIIKKPTDESTRFCKIEYWIEK